MSMAGIGNVSVLLSPSSSGGEASTYCSSATAATASSPLTTPPPSSFMAANSACMASRGASRATTTAPSPFASRMAAPSAGDARSTLATAAASSSGARTCSGASTNALTSSAHCASAAPCSAATFSSTSTRGSSLCSAAAAVRLRRRARNCASRITVSDTSSGSHIATPRGGSMLLVSTSQIDRACVHRSSIVSWYQLRARSKRANPPRPRIRRESTHVSQWGGSRNDTPQRTRSVHEPNCHDAVGFTTCFMASMASDAHSCPSPVACGAVAVGAERRRHESWSKLRWRHCPAGVSFCNHPSMASPSLWTDRNAPPEPGGMPVRLDAATWKYTSVRSRAACSPGSIWANRCEEKTNERCHTLPRVMRLV
mmetsp:Transcript_9532/g.22689  ORF Transcript_9532/g.22689 Transcript_9532/m.22689 type:complete len:369 (-) Transcript_9532:1745-2851(-)